MSNNLQYVDIPEPLYDEIEKRPKTLTKSRRIEGIMYVAGACRSGAERSDVMVVSLAVEEDEVDEEAVEVAGFKFKQGPRHLKGAGTMLVEIAARAGLDLDACYCTALCKWLIPKANRNKPNKKVLNWGLPVLLDEIKRIKPKIIVCLGKVVYDMLSSQKRKFSSVHGAWIFEEDLNALLYVMNPLTKLVGNPAVYETFRVDFSEIQRKQLELSGEHHEEKLIYQVLDNESDLRAWVGRMIEEQHKVFSIDCEWHKRTFANGQLRTFQLAWSDTEAVAIKFRSEHNEFCFELYESPEAEFEKYREIGEILKPLLHQPDVRYVGHHISADWPWLIHWLDLDVLGRCLLDTEFSQQLIDEASELGLERGIAMKYTTLGLYNVELNEWKRNNKALCIDGYGYIPDDIIIPYAIRDVIAPFRAWPQIMKVVESQGLQDYHDNIMIPFVTDIFTTFTVTGLPADLAMLEDLRELFQFTRRHLEVTFTAEMRDRARTLVFNKLLQVKAEGFVAGQWMGRLLQDEDVMDQQKAAQELQELDPETPWVDLMIHYRDAPFFNIRSPEQMRRWLFKVEGLTPIKTTNQKAKGRPSMGWESVLELPEDQQKQYTPAVDKQTVQILAEQLPMLEHLLDLNFVGNVCKGFLKEPKYTINDETGEEEIEEQGVLQWVVQPENMAYNYLRVCALFSSTETGRPRAWMPNVLNWPSHVQPRIGYAVMKSLKEAEAAGVLPPNLRRWLDISDPKDIPSIRSCIQAPPGYVLVEHDYDTAELVALSKIAKDDKMSKIFEGRDPAWVVLKPGRAAETVRVAFDEYDATGISPALCRQEFLMSAWANDKKYADFTEDDLLRDADGNLVHAKYDMHWMVVERTYGKPREMMKKKPHRDSGKVLNFCVAGDALVETRDRGAVEIRNIRLEDLVWDGVEWVQHEGVISTGRKEIIEYQGLRATRLHDVWTAERGKVKFEEACAESLTLVRTSTAGQVHQPTWDPDLSGVSGTAGVGLLLHQDRVSELRERAMEGTAECRDGQIDKVQVHASTPLQSQIPGSRSGSIEVSDASVRCDDAAVLQGHSRVVAPLPGSRDQSGVQGSRGLCDLGSGEVYGRSDSDAGLRPGGKRRALLQGEPAVGGSVDEPDESGIWTTSELSRSAAVSGRPSRSQIHMEDGAGAHENGAYQRADLDEACAKFSCGEAETYDLLNAGPRHRFTCQGVLVSNSSLYGASPNTLERKIESDTGAKPDPGTGQAGLDAIEARQPRATEFLREMEKIPETTGYYRAASGRLRRCVTHGRNAQISWRTRNSVVSALGREMRNFPMQESVAATAARAGIWLLKAYKMFGLKARPMIILYDSVVTLCPLEERFVVSHLHDLFMCKLNTWRYIDVHGDRTLQYSSTGELNYRWSCPPPKSELAILQDESWNPTPDRLKWILNFQNWDMVKATSLVSGH